MDELHPERDDPSIDRADRLFAWLRSLEFLSETEAPGIAVLVAYQSGALSATARQIVERGLTFHSTARAQLRSTREALRTLRALPWSEVALRSRAEGLIGQVAPIWLALTIGSVAAAPSAQMWWQAQDWPSIHRQMAAGVIEAKAAWAGFLSFGKQLHAALQLVGPERGLDGSDAPTVLRGELPPGIVLALSANVGVEGMLEAILFVRDGEGCPSLLLAGVQIQLLLLVNGQTWPLADAEVEEDRANWAFPELGATLNLAVGSLPGALFCIAFQDAPLLKTDRAMSLLGEVLDADGKRTEDLPARLELRSEPRWEAGRFYLDLALPEPVRIAYDAYLLRLDVVVFGNTRQCLGYWPIRDWSEAPYLLTADCPGSQDTVVPYASVLHAALQPL